MASIVYHYTLATTESTTGYFSCEPAEHLTFEVGLALLEQTPNDEFLHRHLLRRVLDMPPAEKAAWHAERARRPVLNAMFAEAALLEQEDTGQSLSEPDVTPLPYLAWKRAYEASDVEEMRLVNDWNELFLANQTQHHPLPHPEDALLPAAILKSLAQKGDESVLLTISTVHERLRQSPGDSWERPPAQETAARALANLASSGVLAGVEMRHESSLSPIGLLRRWNVDMDVQSGSLEYRLQGEATTWGRGLSLAEARASYAMEMVERASAYLSVSQDMILGLAPSCSVNNANPGTLVKARFSELIAQGKDALDPNLLPLPIPCRDQSLYWIQGHAAPTTNALPVLVPVQAVGLFCNLDEPALFLAPGSTGLASGNTLDEAKVAALTEILERDAEATVPWARRRCFELLPPETTDAPHVAALLQDYAARGIQIRFMDMGTEFGLPCYQCFVGLPDGTFARGTGAGLSGRRAILSALTETPYPYPNGPASAPALPGLPQRRFASLPDYLLESPARNLELLETVLIAHGRRPVYVELTREDLEFPVVRALIPGLELVSDFDRFSRPPVRLFARYLKDSL